jgi:Rod binding domain-containing protein
MQTMTINTAQTQVLEAQLAAARSGVNAAGVSDADKAAARRAAEDFEAVFISQMLQPMFENLPTDGPMGGGHAENVYRGMFVTEAGKAIAKNGGVGIADNVYRELIKLQEG